MKVILNFILLVFLISSCQNTTHGISGKLKTNDDYKSTIYLLDPVNLDGIAASYLSKIVDSAEINKSGYFEFNSLPEISDNKIFQLAVQKKDAKYLNALENDSIEISNYIPIIYDGVNTIKLTADISQFQKTVEFINPSLDNKNIIKLRNLRHQAFQEFSKSKSGDIDKLIELEDARQDFRRHLINFANNSNSFLLSMIALRWVSVNKDYERNPEFLVDQCKMWTDRDISHPLLPQLCELANKKNLPILIGGEIPDFLLPMSTRDTINLYKLSDKKITILDLWASWCPPCRKENKKVLVPLYDQYKDRGLEIIGYALDSDYDTWIKSIEKDGADRWIHASHLEGDFSPLMDRLRLTTIPANIIYDENKVIIGKNLHGEELVVFVEDRLR